VKKVNKKLVFTITIVLAISLVVNGYLYATLIQTQNHASTQISKLEDERDSLKTEVATLVT
jgi:cell division protein FtsB